MFLRVRKHTTYANIMLTVALVFAMSGGAFAATKYLITSTKQIKPSVLKQLQGKAGAKGATGAAGPAGPQGAPGAAGAKGEPGAPGTNGANAEATAFTGAKGSCTAGGAEIKTASPAVDLCDGKEGKAGKEGSPWTAGGVLPAEKSETGTWTMVYTATAAGQPMSSAISYPIPLEEAPEETHVIGAREEYAGEPKEAAAIKEGKCSGTNEKPEAAPGNLCVFTTLEGKATEYLFHGLFPSNILLSSAYGASVALESTEAGIITTGGTWVVTEKKAS